MACLHADGKLEPGQEWRQESIIGSRFTGRFRLDSIANRIIPTIAGRAFITAESTLVLDESDPFKHGIRP
jgi:4-hydroxyproline epimerase